MYMCIAFITIIIKNVLQIYSELFENIIGTLHKKRVNSVCFFIVYARAVFMLSSCLRSGKASHSNVHPDQQDLDLLAILLLGRYCTSCFITLS